MFTKAGQVFGSSVGEVIWEHVSEAKEFHYFTVFQIFSFVKNIVMVHDYQIILNKLRWSKKHQLVRILANTTIIDKHTCEICVFSWQLVQALHGLKIWKRYFRGKTVLIRANLKRKYVESSQLCTNDSNIQKINQMSACRGVKGKTTGQITELKNLIECTLK